MAIRSAIILVCSSILACAESVPNATDVPITDATETDNPACQPAWAFPAIPGDNPACQALATDYSPGDDKDQWPACISDDDTYHPFDQNISTIARVSAFEEIAGLLFTGSPPGAKAFLDARVAYSQDQGLESRVSRREDEHYPAAAKKCQDMTQDELAQNRDRCVGPAQIQPLLNAAFKDGSEGKDAMLNAARIEAGLLWFLYVSTHKEATTCASVKKDCDSHYAYYTGGKPRSEGLGLSRYVRALSLQAHGRTWDGILAVRCWRDLDGADAATDKAMQGKAVGQLDKALLRGMALLLNSRVKAVEEAKCAEQQAAYWITVQVLGHVLDREATARDPAQAKVLRDQTGKAAAPDADLKAIAAALDAVFPCP